MKIAEVMQKSVEPESVIIVGDCINALQQDSKRPPFHEPERPPRAFSHLW
jgi:hypothetical protein